MKKEQIIDEINTIMAERNTEHVADCTCGDPTYEEKSVRLRYLRALLASLDAKKVI